MSNLNSIGYSIEDNDEKYEFLKADLKNQEMIDNALMKFQPDRILHLAAETHVDRSIINPRVFLETNVRGTFNLLESAKNYWFKQGKPENFRFHHVSTDEVFGSLGEDAHYEALVDWAKNISNDPSNSDLPDILKPLQFTP